MEARARVLALLRARETWPEGALREASVLRPGLFKEVMAGLLHEGLAEARWDIRGRTQYLPAVPALPSGMVLAGPVTPVAQRVLAWLVESGRPEGSRRIAQALALPVGEVDVALLELVGLGRVLAKRVGNLVIYRVPEPGQASRTS
ncbi:hypothetical protein [Deinococcus aquiradiocola]|uniref:Uncharacterized protein n=1 Tax=Deinococcus aquiradiocola TaxID=393059 RepID=A0A917ULG4_9DEIO|nr:hypothetical protein [Deinococcus aquiradiocola]GGJ65582.1 hypothetical protein GCM10008939_06940 [Deinococcus aquiradiocola]